MAVEGEDSTVANGAIEVSEGKSSKLPMHKADCCEKTTMTLTADHNEEDMKSRSMSKCGSSC